MGAAAQPHFLPLVERAAELGWLESRLRSASVGSPRVISLLGEAGIGKSRLVRELSELARQSGMAVCVGRGHEDMQLPHLTLSRSLAAWRDQLSATQIQVLREQHPSEIASLERLILSEGRRDPGQDDVFERSQGAHELFAGVAHAVLLLARSSPALLVFEDLHWSDAPSLDLLSQLIFRVADSRPTERVPLMVLLVSRPPAQSPRVARLLARLAREPICEELFLTGLSEQGVRRLVENLTGSGRVSQQLVGRVMEITRGNPLFVRELVAALEREGEPDPIHGASAMDALVRRGRLPSSITGALSEQLSALERRCVRVLEAAALLGDTFQLDRVADVLEQPPDVSLEALSRGIEADLIQDHGGGWFEFRHPLIRHAAANRLPATSKERLHLRIARSYARGSDSITHALSAANHWMAAGSSAPSQDVLEATERAGDVACATYAWSDAARYLIAAAHASTRCADRSRTAGLHEQAGICLRNDADYAAALEQLDRAIELYKESGDTLGAARALHRRVRTTFHQVEYGEPVDAEQLESAAAAVADADLGLAGLLWEALCELRWLGGDLTGAECAGERAREIGHQLEDDYVLHHADLGLGLVRFQQMRFGEALDLYEASARAASRLGDLCLETPPRLRALTIHLARGDLEAADHAWTGAAALIAKIQSPSEASMGLGHRTAAALIRGRLAEVEQEAQATMDMVQRSGYPFGGGLALQALAAARCLRGAWSEAIEAVHLIETPGKLFDAPSPMVRGLGAVCRELIALLSGEEMSAERERRVRGFHAVLSSTELDALTVGPACATAELLVALGDPEPMASLYERLSRAASCGVLITPGWGFLLPRVLGSLAAALGRSHEAHAHYDVARDRAKRIGAWPELARTELDRAEWLAREGDSAAAASCVFEAGQLFERMGAVPWRRRCARLARSLGTPLARTRLQAAGRALPGDLTARQRDLVRRIAWGQTDAVIADALLAPPEIIAADIRTLLIRIEAENRAGAVAYAFEHGLVVREDLSADMSLALLVTDLTGFTPMVERLGDAHAQRVIRAYNGILRSCLHQQQGAEVTHTGDGIIASFIEPRAAVRCAIDMQRELRRYTEDHRATPLRARMGICTGTAREEEGRLFGAAINAAVRICNLAEADQILVSDAVREGAEDLWRIETRGEAVLKGFREPAMLHQVCWE